MTTNNFQLIKSLSLQPESSQTSPILDASPQDSQRERLRDTQGPEEDNNSPLVSTRTGNATEREEPSVAIKPVETNEIKIVDELPKRAPRRRFYSHTGAKPNKENTEENQIPSGRLNTFQNEAEGLDNKTESSESPTTESLEQKKDPTKPLKPSRFRKPSYDFRGSLETSAEDTPSKMISKMTALLEQSKQKRLRAGASTLLKKVTLTNSKPPTTSLTFDAFVDKRKGIETIKTDYPSHKADKRLM